MYLDDATRLRQLVDVSAIDQALTTTLGSGFSAGANGNSVSFGALFTQVVTGQLDVTFSGLLGAVGQLFFSELLVHVGLMQQLVFIAVLAALLKVLSDSFETKSVSEMGFYVCYLALVAIIFTSFRYALGVTSGMVSQVTHFVQVSIPVVVSLVLMTGQAAGGMAYNSLFLFGIWAINTWLMPLLLTFITFLVTVQVVNYLSENELLKNMASLLESALKRGTKAFAALFLFILGLQRISAPILDNLATRGVRLTVNAVPVVGGALSGAVDSIFYLAQAGKNGVIVAVVIGLIYIGMVPLLKLFIMTFLYKVVAAVIEPIADKRIVKCLDTVGNCMGLLLGAASVVMLMFSFALVLLVSFT